MRAFLKEEDDRWRPVLETAGLKEVPSSLIPAQAGSSIRFR